MIYALKTCLNLAPTPTYLQKVCSIKVFDLPKKKGDKGWETLEHELKTLGETDLEEYLTRTEMGADTNGDLEDDDMNGWINELEFLTDEELAELDDYLKPLRVMLAKVSGH